MSKFASALLSVTIILITALAAVEEYTVDAIAQIVILLAGAIVTYIVPLVEGKWAGRLKTGAAIVAAVAAALAPLLISGAYTPQAIFVVILAGLNALAVEVGVGIRQDADAIRAATVGGAGVATNFVHFRP